MAAFYMYLYGYEDHPEEILPGDKFFIQILVPCRVSL